MKVTVQQERNPEVIWPDLIVKGFTKKFVILESTGGHPYHQKHRFYKDSGRIQGTSGWIIPRDTLRALLVSQDSV